MRIPVALASALVVLAIAGCTPAKSPVLPAPVPSTTPLFASDEEALAAAEEAYGAYLAVSDLIISEGGANPERLLEVATPEVLAQELGSYQRLKELGWHSVGSTTLASVSLQSFDQDPEAGFATVVVYACVDIAQVDMVDTSGASVVSPSRVDVNPFQTSFKYVDDSLLLASKDPWEGNNFCVD